MISHNLVFKIYFFCSDFHQCFAGADDFNDDNESYNESLNYHPLKSDLKLNLKAPITHQLVTTAKIKETRIPKVTRKKGEKAKKEPLSLYPCSFCGLEFKKVQLCIRHEIGHTGIK